MSFIMAEAPGGREDVDSVKTGPPGAAVRAWSRNSIFGAASDVAAPRTVGCGGSYWRRNVTRARIGRTATVPERTGQLA